MILAQEMSVEEGRAAADHLQQMVDLLDLSDSLDCRNIAKGC
jgi:hypothetical protein